MKHTKLVLLFIVTNQFAFSQARLIDSLQKEYLKADEKTKIVVLADIGYNYRLMNPDSAMAISIRALKWAEKANFTQGIANALNSIGSAYRIQGDMQHAMSYHFEALRVAEKNKLKVETAKTTLGIGSVYFDLKEYESAIIHMKKAAQIFNELNNQERYNVTLGNMGEVYLKSNLLDSALVYLKKPLVFSHFINTSAILPFCYSRLGATYLALKMYDSAYVHSNIAIQLGMSGNNKRVRSYSYQVLGEYFMALGKKDSAIHYAEQAFRLATANNYNWDVLASSNTLSKLYEDIDLKQALYYANYHKSLNDSISGVDQVNALQKKIIQEQEIARKKDADALAYKNRFKQNSLLVGLGIVGFVGFLLYRNNVQKEKINKKLHQTQSLLQITNRDLEIEAALEKVRSRSLAMYSSDELKEVMKVFFEKLKELGLVFDGGTGIHIFNDETRDATIWVYAPFQAPTKIDLPYNESDFENNTIILDVWHAHTTGTHIINKSYSFEEKNKYFLYVFKHNDLNRIPQEARDYILSVPTYTASFVAEKYSLVGANSWTGQLFSTSDFEIVQRVAKVFEQAYVRFMDLQKAEAQAREAKIEASLEIIRSRSLAMHVSDELKDVVKIMHQKLKELDVIIGTVAIQLFDEQNNVSEFWIGTELQDYARIILPFDEEQMKEGYLKDSWDAWRSGDDIINKVHSFPVKNKYFDYVFANNSLEITPLQARDFMYGIEKWTNCLFTEKHSALYADTFFGEQYNTEKIDVLQRVAKVFDQAYVRFLDLKKAEAIARESKIETSLERIRSKSLSMNSSEEINSIIGFIYSECVKLDMHLDRGFIMTFDKNTGDAYWWMVNSEAPDIPMNFFVKYHNHLPNRTILNGFHNKDQNWTYVLEGDDKKNWDSYIFNETELVQLPDFVIKGMKEVPKIILNASFQNFGCIMLSSFEKLSEEHKDLLNRLSKVFDLSYTRYIDLQEREKNTKKIIEEKQKLEITLAQLKTTQAQLIHAEKMASLGELTAGIAHEIQNPLNFVNNFSSINTELIEDVSNELNENNIKEAQELIHDIKVNSEKINHHGHRASSIVQSMLEHSRTSTGKKELGDINQLCDEYLRLSYHGLRAKDKNFNSDFKIDLTVDLPLIMINKQEISRVLLNIINNAFQAVYEKSKKNQTDSFKPLVTIKTEKEKEQIKISIVDNGIGIQENIKEKIFQPFFTTKPTGQGTGLGLSLSYDIIKAHGGTIEVDSHERSGTTFIIKLNKN